MYIFRTLILATGIGQPHKPYFDGANLVEGYEDVSVNATDFEGQSVLILGKLSKSFIKFTSLLVRSTCGHTHTHFLVQTGIVVDTKPKSTPPPLSLSLSVYGGCVALYHALLYVTTFVFFH